MATARTAVGSILGTVTTAASSIGSIFEAVSNTIDIGNAYVTTARETQKVDHEIKLAVHEQRAYKASATEETKLGLELQEFFNADPRNEALWDTNYAAIKAAVQARRNPTKHQQASA